MTPHPFRFPYVGLGLLDPDSIRRDGDVWSAAYPDTAGAPYLHIRLGPDRAEIAEFDARGQRVAITRAATLTEAIGLHGAQAVNGRPSRFWSRVAAQGPVAWCPLEVTVPYTYVPAMGLARLRVPLAAGRPLPPPLAGPLARRLGQDFRQEAHSPLPATLSCRWGWPEPPEEVAILVHRFVVPAILVPELTAAVAAVTGALSGAEWRPWLDPELADRTARHWPSPPPLGEPRSDGRRLTAYTIVEEESVGARP